MKVVPCPAAARIRVVAFAALAGWAAHSGHLIPTALKTMHSVQIGRPQLEQLTAVSFARMAVADLRLRLLGARHRLHRNGGTRR